MSKKIHVILHAQVILNDFTTGGNSAQPDNVQSDNVHTNNAHPAW